MTLSVLDTPPDREIANTRVVKFPRELVYRAWTEPEHLKKWWGPKGFTNTFKEFDFRPGGNWSFVMHGPDKGNYPNECTFVAIKEPEFIIWNHHPHPKFQIEARFEEVSKTDTRIIFKMKFDTVDECNKLKSFAPEKNEENFDRLENELTQMR